VPQTPKGMVLGNDVLALTPKGKAELHGSGTSLSPAELEVMVLLDGRSTAGETAARAQTLGVDVVLSTLGKLVQDGLIELVKDQGLSLDFVDFFETKGPTTSTAAATTKGKKQAAATAALLQEKGYSVRIARRARTALNLDRAQALSVLVIEDDPHLAGLLKHVLTGEGFEVRTAGNREEIVAQIRRPPLPDLVLLDVVLPDANGFDVLLRIRQHPALRTIPVVMLTAQATRDAVLKGLTGGADGYITKPFRIEVLAKAVAAVLGLPGHEDEARDSQDPWSL
jgi:two-component system, OmpR family, response regulator